MRKYFAAFNIILLRNIALKIFEKKVEEKSLAFSQECAENTGLLAGELLRKKLG